jgi:anti-anti-sigma factor
MSIQITHFNHYIIASFSGNIKVDTLPSFTPVLSKCIQAHPGKHLVLELSMVSFLDSSAIRLFINLKKRMESENKNLFLLKPSDTISRILDETNLTSAFTIIATPTELEDMILADQYKKHVPYTTDFNGIRKLNCTCEICGSTYVEGYLLDLSKYTWRWEEGYPFPVSVAKEGDSNSDIFALFPIICLDCYMSSVDISDFNVTDESGTVVFRARIDDNNKHLLFTGIKKRKKMVNSEEIGVGDDFFAFPRSRRAAYYAYLLAESCARTKAINKKSADPFLTGYLTYCALKYANNEEKHEMIDHCRTWLTQALNQQEQYNHLIIAKILFILFVANLNLDKAKEATSLYTQFSELIESMPDITEGDDINNPGFWYAQCQSFWQREIKQKSAVFHPHHQKKE